MASAVANARKTALKTQPEFAKLLKTSTATLCKWEQNPDKWMTPEKLKMYYNNVGEDGKKILRDYAASFFA